MPRRLGQIRASVHVATQTAGVLRAPERFRIWKAGANPGDYGELWFTPEAAAAVMAEYARRGNLLAMDIEHALNPAANPTLSVQAPPITAGYLALELVAGDGGPELWGVPRWSDCGRDAHVPGVICCARHQIESGQRCYVSPDWDLDLETRQPVRLNRVALVAEPATHAINLLASRASAERRGTMDEKDLRAAYKVAKRMAAEGASDEEKKVAGAHCAALKAAADKMGFDPEAEPAAEKKDGEAAKRAAAEESPAEKKSPADAPGAAPSTASAVASRALTEGDLEKLLDARDERAQLLAANKDRIPAGHVNMLAGKDTSLHQLRAYIGGLPPRPAPTGTEGDAGGAVERGRTAAAKGDELPMSPADEVAATHLRQRLGLTTANVVAAKKAIDEAQKTNFGTPVPKGGYAVSIVDLTEQRRAARLATHAGS